MCVRQGEEKRVQCTGVASGKSGPGRLDIHPPRPRISLQRTARDGRCGVNRGWISTCDLTRARYLPPLSLRERREREISIVHRREEIVLPLIPSSPLLSVPFFPQKFDGGFKHSSRLSPLVAHPGPPKKDALIRRLANCSPAKLKFHRPTDNSDER